MGARPSSFKRGGGFLDGVDSTLVEYEFTDEFNGEPFVAGKIKGRDGKTMEKPHSLNCLLSFQVDGAEEPTTTTLKVAGDFDEWDVSEEGHVITPEDKDRELNANSAFSKFIHSLVEAGFPETLFPEDAFDFRAMLGTRLRTVQKTDAARTKEFGPRKGKDGKEYDRKDLIVDQVLELPSSKGSKGSKTTTAPAAKGKKTKDDVAELAADTLRTILGKSGGGILKPKLSTKILNELMKNPQREEVRTWLFNDDNLEGLDFITFDKASGKISLTDAENDE